MPRRRAPSPTERERTQWYFQRYVADLPAAGEIVIFDRSWYNRAGVERVMGFCTDEEYEYFMQGLPDPREAARARRDHAGEVLALDLRRGAAQEVPGPDRGSGRRWKLSPMDMEAQARWVDYAEAKDQMFAYTDTRENPWYVVDAEDKKTARLNLISHLLDQIPYQSVEHEKMKLPPRQERAYIRPPVDSQTKVPERYRVG